MQNVVKLDAQARVDRGFRLEKGKQASLSASPMPVMVPIGMRAMEKTVQTIQAAQPQRRKTKVAAYCRVSTLLESQESSIAAQRRHYHDLICANSAWELAGIYLEAGISGTKAEARPELQRMMADCRAGRIQLILTKSISRFARNTSDCLRMVRDLAALGVNIRFEKERLDTGTMGSELMLSVLACLAEDESHSISGNMKWGIRKRFENGDFIPSNAPYGYRKEGNTLTVICEEAEIVRGIFSDILSGRGMRTIAQELNARGIPGKRGARWTQSTVRRIVHNPVYVGDMLYQKTFMDENYSQKVNKGELDQYYESDHHPPIVSREAFEQAAMLIQERRKLYGAYTEEEDAGLAARRQKRYAFTGKLFCAACGGHLHRMGMKGRAIYQCQNKYTGADSCAQPSVLEDSIKNAFITCLNKLAFSQGLSAKDRIIDAYIGGIRNVEARRHAARIAEIGDALERNRLEMNALTAAALADHFRAERREKKAALMREAEALRRERETVRSQLSQTAAAEYLRRFTAHWTVTDKTDVFPEGEFARLVEKAVVVGRESITFHFACGMRLTEALGR